MAFNEFIFNGLKQAIEKGESLESAMLSFYNAGYNKIDIEDSARALQRGAIPQENSANVVSKVSPKREEKDTLWLYITIVLGVVFLSLSGVLIYLLLQKQQNGL